MIDHFALGPLSETERRDLLDVLEDRYANRATVITSQLPPERWHDNLGDPTVADAICDRVLHDAQKPCARPRSAVASPPDACS